VTKRALVFSTFLAAVAFAPPLYADNVPDPTAAALFRKGRDLVESGEWEKGCEQLRSSLARYESASTVLNIARCEEHFGRVASAWALFQRGLVLARGEPGAERREALERVAREGIDKTEGRLPKLEIDVASPPPGLEVRESSRPLPIGEAVPLDPGPHDLVAQAPGYETAKQHVVLEEGKTTKITFELRARAPSEPDGAASVAEKPKPQPVDSPSSPAPEPARERGGIPTWAWISGGTGLVLIGAATAFALDARAQRDKLVEECGSDFVCDENPNFNPGPVNARKNRSLGLAIGLGSAGLLAIGASVVGIVGASSERRSAVRPSVFVSSRQIFVAADLAL
jgi:hypothetical protein